MKRKLMSLLLAVVMVVSMLPVTAKAADDINLKATCTAYTVEFSVSGASVTSAAATPNGNGGTLNIVVASGSGTSVTVGGTFSNYTVPVPKAVGNLTLDISSGSAEGNYTIQACQPNGQPMGTMGIWTVTVTVDSGSSGGESDEEKELTFSGEKLSIDATGIDIIDGGYQRLLRRITLWIRTSGISSAARSVRL